MRLFHFLLKINSTSEIIIFLPSIAGFNVGFPFAKRLRNFCETKRKIFLSLRISFARKNSNLRNHSQKSFRAKIALFRFFATGVLRNSAIPQFRYDHRVYFLELKCFQPVSEFWKNLVLECLAKLLLVTLNILDQ